jgi:hypothetical protein
MTWCVPAFEGVRSVAGGRFFGHRSLAGLLLELLRQSRDAAERVALVAVSGGNTRSDAIPLFGRERADDPVPFEDAVQEEAQRGSESAPGGTPQLLWRLSRRSFIRSWGGAIPSSSGQYQNAVPENAVPEKGYGPGRRPGPYGRTHMRR